MMKAVDVLRAVASCGLLTEEGMVGISAAVGGVGDGELVDRPPRILDIADRHPPP